jgi:hypothetical protein
MDLSISSRRGPVPGKLFPYLSASTSLAVLLCLASPPSMAETRGYIISWFATATDIPDYKVDCPLGHMDGQTEMNVRQLREIGYSQAQAVKIVADSGAQLTPQYTARIDTNARVNGKPASVFNYPDATADPNIETVTGPYAYGFDLGGPAANKFIDPETHQKVDNQLWRAVGCTESFHAAPPGKPYPEELSWNLMIDSAPAWTLQLAGPDLSHDGPVTITLDSATQHLERDANGNVLPDYTYVVEPDSPSHNVLHGEIRNGVLTVTPQDIYLEGELPFYAEIALRDTHMRFKAEKDGTLVGYWGGYLNWRRYVYMYTARPPNGADSIGLYHALKKFADSDPDPKTGENRYISGTFRMEALPAFLARADGKVIAGPVHNPGALQQVQAAHTAVTTVN